MRMTITGSISAALVLACVALGSLAGAADPAASSPAKASDDAGALAGWKLSTGQGRVVEGKYLEVTGDGAGSNRWQTEFTFNPGEVWRFQTRARTQGASGGCAVAGPDFANHDCQPHSEWADFGHVFRVPDNVRKSAVHLGQWEAKGTFQFDRPRLTRVLPVHLAFGPLTLGAGETLREGKYTFSGVFGGPSGNVHRTLHSTTATFNTDRWCFAGADQVTYRFELAGLPFRAAKAGFHVNYHTRGTCLAEVSRDGQQWRPLASRDRTGAVEAALPSELLPAETLYLRLRTADPRSSFQVQQVEFTAEAADGRTLIGQTSFAEIERSSPDLAVDNLTLTDSAAGQRVLRLTARQRGDGDLGATLSGRMIAADGQREVALPSRFAQLDGGRPAAFELPLPEPGTGESIAVLQLDAAGAAPLGLRLRLRDHEFHRSDYGQRIGGCAGPHAVWWCDATWKVARRRPVPEASSPAAELSAARNDYEAVQIVVRPEKPLQGLTAAAGPLRGPGDATIAAENIELLRVAYHFVQHPTDATGVVDLWPDALPPLRQPLDLAAGANQPLWVLVHVPADAPPGDYQGEVALRAEGWSAAVPLKLHVWNFALPAKNHLETALGLSHHTVFQYHQAKTEADQRRVWEMYLRSFAAHRISPYDPVPLDPIGVKLLPDADPPRAELDWSRFDPAMARAVEQHRFTNFMLHLQAMGGGTFHQRFEPTIGKYGETTPQYQAVFASYAKQLESHLREKGWLGMVYTYWFDEPDPKDYAFVRAGMERIKKHAPGLTNMLTEEPNEALAGPIDIWCPVTPNYRKADAEQRRSQGERLWWYVCCGPKAPYCTLFIDHPATELRVWLWQTWQRNIAGILIWSTNYWTSDTAFPGAFQNPYDDPMGYVSGYGVPRGTKQYWGNGDGRFVYPPEAAAVPGKSGPAAVFEPPVSSIRWEMLREGVEDYEFLHLLRDLIGRRAAALAGDAAAPGVSPARLDELRRLLDVPEDITRDMTKFTSDPAPLYARRRQIATAIEELSR